MSEQGKRISAQDVDQQALVKAMAAFLKKFANLKLIFFFFFIEFIWLIFKNRQTKSSSMERRRQRWRLQRISPNWPRLVLC